MFVKSYKRTYLDHKIRFSKIVQKRLELELSCKNNIFDPSDKLFKSKKGRF